MSDTAENIAVCNQSLGLLGAKAITVGATTGHNYKYCVTFFDDARDEMLAAGRWNFAKKRGFAIETTKPLFGWDLAFTKPTDAVKIWGIEEQQDARFEVEGGLILTDLGEKPPDWETDKDYLAGQYIQSDDSGDTLSYLVDEAFTSDTETADLADHCTSAGGDLSTLAIEYVYQRTDVDSWPVAPRQCLIINLARMLVSAIKQKPEVALNLQAMLYGSKKVTGYLDVARSQDAQEGGIMSVSTNTLMASRHSRGYWNA